jgi:hypothetical protein
MLTFMLDIYEVQPPQCNLWYLVFFEHGMYSRAVYVVREQGLLSTFYIPAHHRTTHTLAPPQYFFCFKHLLPWYEVVRSSEHPLMYRYIFLVVCVPSQIPLLRNHAVLLTQRFARHRAISIYPPRQHTPPSLFGRLQTPEKVDSNQQLDNWIADRETHHLYNNPAPQTCLVCAHLSTHP